MYHARRGGIACSLALLVACATPDSPGTLTMRGVPLAAHLPDEVGLPDLTVDAQKLGTSWVMYMETIPAGSCTAVEGGVTSGEHRTLRFTVSTPNNGDADLVIGDPNRHFDPNGDGNPADSDGLYEFATCHNHLHFRNYATYELLPILADGSLGPAIDAAKRGFCMIDVKPVKSDAASPKGWEYRSCGLPPRAGLPGIPGNQGISTGWADVYDKSLSGQLFVVDDLPEGRYVIRIVVNPPFVPLGGEPCPHRDSANLCHMLPESDFSNNIGAVAITIPAGRPGKKGWGPGGGEELSAEAYSSFDKLRAAH